MDLSPTYNSPEALQRRTFTGADIDLRQRPEAPRSGASRPFQRARDRRSPGPGGKGLLTELQVCLWKWPSEKLTYLFKQRGSTLSGSPNSWNTASSNYFPPSLKDSRTGCVNPWLFFFMTHLKKKHLILGKPESFRSTFSSPLPLQVCSLLKCHSYGQQIKGWVMKESYSYEMTFSALLS